MTTTQNKARNRLEYESKFLQLVCDQTKNDNAAKADFKRALSGESEHVRKVYRYVLPYVGNASEWELKQILIPVACLSVYYPSDSTTGNFGHSCRELAKATNSEGADRRFRALLDLSLADIKSPLTALVRQMKSKEIAINYPQLLADLRQWEHPNEYVQDQWARAFWGAPLSSSDEAELVVDDPQ